LGNHGWLRRRLRMAFYPGKAQEFTLRCLLRIRHLRQRGAIIWRLLKTAAGRKRVRIGVYSHIPRTMWRLAYLYRGTLLRRVGIITVVGSFGKTTTTRAVLSALGLEAARHTGWNSRSALPDAILCINPQAKHAVIEVGISDKGQMEGHARLLKPNIAVVACIGSEHMSSLGSLEITRAEKAKMVAAIPPSGLVVLNGDDPNVLWMRDLSRARVITYGFGEPNEVRATDIVENELSGVRFNLQIDGRSYDIRTRLIGRHMIYPILAAATVAHEEGYDLSQAIAALEQLDPTHNRLQPIQLPGCGAWVLMDAYKAALETIEVALDALSELSATRKIVVLGDVEEPPGSQGIIYKALGRRLAEIADRVIFVGGKKAFNSLRAGAISGGLSPEMLAHTRTDPFTLVQMLNGLHLGAGDIVLIKGRSTQHLERVALILEGEEVTCTTRSCSRRHDCYSCPLRRSKNKAPLG